MDYPTSTILSQQDLKTLNKNKNYLLVKAKFGPSIPTKIPLKLNIKLAFFAAVIIGDGHLRKNKKQITIELTNKLLIQYIEKTCNDLFNRKFNIKSRIKNDRPSYYMLMDSKAIYNLLNIVFEIPYGKKSHIVKVPEIILNSSKKIKKAFLMGILSTEGGKRKRKLGLSTASKQLQSNLISLFSDLKMSVNQDKWINKKYKKEYYGLSFEREYFTHLSAGMPEWSNGLRLGEILVNFKE